MQLAQSPLLSAYAGLIAPAVIGLELLLAGLLCFRSARLAGLYGSFFLMIAFTVYIYLILNYSDFVPCSCGGIIEKLGWREHLAFNLAFAALALPAILLLEKRKNTRAGVVALKSVLPAVASAGLVVGLFLSSEHIIKKENNFIRRFGQHPVRDEKSLDLGADSYYFAGIDGGQIYLGNTTAPLILTAIDTALTTIKAIKIQLDNTEHRFRFVQAQVKPPHFYLYDGTVPVIYRGQLGDSLARTVSLNDCYFSQLQVTGSMTFAFRAQSSQSKALVLGRLSPDREPKVILHETLLEKQVDGMFDTDGGLLRDDVTGELLYVYIYRNRFLVMDEELNLLRKLHTIDTTSRAQVRVRALPDGRHKMDAPPLQVNKTPAVHGQLLFNQSMLMGKFESREQWRQAAVIDMYRTGDQEYLGSFYVHHRGKDKLSGMLATDKHLFVLRGRELLRYRFAQAVSRHFVAGEAENLEQSRR
ncbi:MauE/DoxX family redox-associated membrane protein [Gaoshiqia sp. Z1-71]|uniref:MauE/DoxX family redox-associated membrane protein n=1 Tax=Gaoshiqia hydrogeniformans TaxID=3290090 RepID=UPI003BF7DA8E